MELIKITTQQDGNQVVSARELYETLGYDGSQFSRWAKKNIIENKFATESEDYIGFDINVEGNGVKDYALAIDFAKKLCMISKTKIGEKVRNYFIEREKVSFQKTALPSAKELALLVIKAEEEKERLQITNELQAKELKEAAPKVQFVDEVLSSSSTITTTIIAKELGMGAPTLNKMLHQMGIIYPHNGTWLLYHSLQNKDLAKTKTYTYTNSKGETGTNIQLVWTNKGRLFIHERINQNLQRRSA
jgi:anti-repressor protein